MRRSKGIKIGPGDYAGYLIGRFAFRQQPAIETVLTEGDCKLLRQQRDATQAFVDLHDAFNSGPAFAAVQRHAALRGLPFRNLAGLDVYNELSISLQAAAELPPCVEATPQFSRLWAEAHVAMLEAGEVVIQLLREPAMELAFYAAHRSLCRRNQASAPIIEMGDFQFMAQTDLTRRCLDASQSRYFGGAEP